MIRTTTKRHLTPLAAAFLALTPGAQWAAAQDFALEQLEKSPRHHEWVDVEAGKRKVQCFVAFPERKDDALAVIVIHENRGLTDWVRSFADQLAGAGFIAVAPDLLSGFDEDHGRTRDFASSDDARNAIYKLEADQVTADLLAVQRYASKIDAANGKTAVVGFCWGGSQSFRLATNAKGLSAALVFYGTAPTDSTVYSRITAPVHGFYGGEDQRVNATLATTEAFMNVSGKTFEKEIYEGAGHAFMRHGDDPEGTDANRAARDKSWVRLKKILEKYQ